MPEGRSTLKNGAWLSPLNTANAFLFTNALFPGKETVNALILVSQIGKQRYRKSKLFGLNPTVLEFGI